MSLDNEKNILKKKITETEETNSLLALQVKRLLQTEHDLYASQTQIDRQMKLYYDLFETGRFISSCRNKNSIFNKLVYFALYSLEAEKGLVLKNINGINLFRIEACDGFYNDEKVRAENKIYLDTSLLQKLSCKNFSPIVIHGSSNEFKISNETLDINNFVIYPLCSEEKQIEYIIIAGNSEKKAEFHSEITENDIFVSAFGSLILQASDSLKTLAYLEELQMHRNHLESEIRERTKELERSNSILLDEITERKKTEEKLTKALREINTLEGIFPICSNCKNVRDDEGNWKSVEQYISTHSKAEFSHSLCPDCLKKLYPEYAK